MEEDKLKKKSIKKLNTGRVNDLVKTGNKILRILYILFIILLVYVVSLIFKEWKNGVKDDIIFQCVIELITESKFFFKTQEDLMIMIKSCQNHSKN